MEATTQRDEINARNAALKLNRRLKRKRRYGQLDFSTPKHIDSNLTINGTAALCSFDFNSINDNNEDFEYWKDEDPSFEISENLFPQGDTKQHDYDEMENVDNDQSQDDDEESLSSDDEDDDDNDDNFPDLQIFDDDTLLRNRDLQLFLKMFEDKQNKTFAEDGDLPFNPNRDGGRTKKEMAQKICDIQGKNGLSNAGYSACNHL